MRIAHIITRMIVGGAQENTLLTCLDLLRDYGDDVLLVTGPSLGPEGDLLGQGRGGELQVATVPALQRAIHPQRDWLAARQLRRQLMAFGPDVVHTHSAKGGILGRHVAWSMGVPAIVHTVHGAPFHPYQPLAVRTFYRFCERRAARQCHRLVSVADAMTDLMVDGQIAPREKFTTVYSGMDIEPFLHADQTREEVRAELGLAAEHVVFGKIARLFHLKGHDDLIEASRQVIRQIPEVRFLLVGDGILRPRLQRRIEQLGIAKHFIFTGLVAPVEIPRLIGAIDALVHTSYREGLARALPQALIAGKPAVSYDVDGAREVVIDDQTGYLVPPGDTGLLAERLTRLAGDAERRQRLGAEGRQRFTEQFRHQTMTRRLREIYATLLQESEGRGERKAPVSASPAGE